MFSMGGDDTDGESASGSSDVQLLLRARGDASAFGVFYDRFERDVLAYFVVETTGRG